MSEQELVVTEQAPLLDGAAVEAAMLEKEKASQASTKTSPADVAAAMFSLYFPKWGVLLNKLSKKALVRTLATVMAEPLEDLKYEPKTQDEKDAMAIARSLFEAKMLMFIHTFNENMEKTNEALNQVKEETKGETNG